MGVKIKKRGGKWYVFVNYHGRRKAKCVGSSRDVAEKVQRQLEARLALGDLGFFAGDAKVPTFGEYATRWMREHANLHCKPSTIRGYTSVLKLHLRPRFESVHLDRLSRHQGYVRRTVGTGNVAEHSEERANRCPHDPERRH